MSPPVRRRSPDAVGVALRRSPAGPLRRDPRGAVVAPRRTPAGVLRRERRALLRAREEALRDLGGLLVEMYRRGGFRDDLLQERAGVVVGLDARLGEIDDLLHGSRRTARCECGAPVLRGSRFCPNCGRTLRAAAAPDET